MKRTHRIAAVAVIAALAIVIGTQFALSRYLTAVVRAKALPAAERALGVDVDVRDVRFRLPGGILRLSDLRVGNPPGFDERDALSAALCRFDLALVPLLFGDVAISRVFVDGAKIRIVRNRSEQVNAQLLGRTAELSMERRRGPSGGPAAAVRREPEGVPAGPRTGDGPDIRIDDLVLAGDLEYVDHLAGDGPFRICMALELKAEGLTTVGQAGEEWSPILLRGHLSDDPEAFVMELRGRLGPLVDASKLDFDLEGGIAAVDPGKLGPAADGMGVSGRSASLAVRAVCRAGRYDRAASSLSLTLKEPRLTGRAAETFPGIDLPAEITITAPLGGTLMNPDVKWEAAATHAFLSCFSSGVDSLLESASVNGRPVAELLEEHVDADEAVEAVTDALKTLDRLFGGADTK
ncbi:hypothetical protein ACFLSJ_00850 [Verrucomicrobiota bacterium]